MLTNHGRICGELAERQDELGLCARPIRERIRAEGQGGCPQTEGWAMLTNAYVKSLVARAVNPHAVSDVERYDWAMERGSSRPPVGANGWRHGLKAFLVQHQGGICPQCGNALRGPVEFCHIVARGPKVKGFVEGNIFAGHPGCNASTKPSYDETGALQEGREVLYVEDLERPDLVAMEWPCKSVLKGM
jgi:hypothetical protein